MIPPVHFQTLPLNAEALREAARSSKSGAVLVFEGCARDNHDGRNVLELSYEAYEPMALAQLEAMRREAMDKYSLHSCLIHHRLGPTPLAEAAVVIVCASEHRQESLRAMAWLLDELKERATIWKRELYGNNLTSWVEGDARVRSE